MKKLAVLTTLLFAFVITAPLPGCDEETTLKERAKIQARYDAALAAGNGTEAAYYHDLLDKADAKIAAVKSDPVPATVEDASHSTLVNLIPEPIRSPLVLGAGLFVSLWRMFKWKGAAQSIAKSIEKLPDSTNWTSDTTALILDANQTPMAKAAVDLTQGKKTSLLDRFL